MSEGEEVKEKRKVQDGEAEGHTEENKEAMDENKEAMDENKEEKEKELKGEEGRKEKRMRRSRAME